MKKQCGYINLDGLFLTLTIVLLIAGMLLLGAIQVIWPYAKMFIHQITG